MSWNFVQTFYVLILFIGSCLIGSVFGWRVGLGVFLVGFSVIPMHRS